MRRLFKLESFLIAFGIITVLFVSCMSCMKTVRNTIVYPNPNLAAKYHYSVAQVETTPGIRGDIGRLATAWAIDKDHLMTAGHFCDSHEDGVLMKKASPILHLTQVGPDGTPIDIVEAFVWKRHKEKDMCILLSPDHPFVPLVVSSNFGMVTTEDPITVVGAPKGFFPVRREGTIAQKYAHQFKGHEDMMLLAVDIQPGNSGCPVIWAGEVIGMAVMKPYRLHASALAVPAPQIQKFIEDALH